MSRALLINFLFACLLFAPPGLLAANNPNEYELKAVMLFNLARFVDWPSNSFANSNSPIVIAILGRNPFGENTLEKAVEGETVNGRSIVIQHPDNLQSLKACHILFISASEKPRLSQILSRLKGQPVLTVSEIEGFSRMPGGMVRFYTNEEKKIRLRLNLESAKAEGLGVSSKLIKVAELDKVSLLSPPFPQIPRFEIAASPAYFPFSALPK